MKKIVLLLVGGLSSFAIFTAAYAQIVVKSTPVVITKQGDYYVVPEGTPVTTEYYTYSADNVDYVCSYTQPTELSTVTPLSFALNLGTTTSNVYCYPQTYYTLTPP